MVSWEAKLRVWGYPEEKVSKTASSFRKLGLRPEKYESPVDVFRGLKRKKVTVRKEELRALGIWDGIKWFFGWIWDHIFAPFGMYTGLILGGALITWIARGWYRSLGAVPIIGGVYGMLKQANVV